MIEVKNLCKQYGGHFAVQDISFTIEKGHVYGFLGPNGAGKSTTMNIITGCLAATSGQVFVDGHDIYKESRAAKRLIGYLPEQPPLYQEMTVEDYLQFVAEAKEVVKSEREAEVASAMEMTGLKEVEGRVIRHLSKGFRQRVGIAQALIGKPEIIILDEPTVGLDPKQIIEIRELIRKLGEEHTVVLSSHILSEVRSICDRIIIISKGKLMANDTPENLEQLFVGKATVEAAIKADEATVRQVAETIPQITEVTYAAADEASPVAGAAKVVFTTDGSRDICEDLFFGFAKIEKPIVRLAAAKVSLEDVFLELTDSDAAERQEEAASERQEEITSDSQEEEVNDDESHMQA